MIGIVATGGTIGSAIRSSGDVSVKKNAVYALLGAYRAQFGDSVAFSVFEPYQILSENLTSAHILSLTDELVRLSSELELEGLIVTHGTDTLPYIAAYLSYLCGALPIPIVLVSSNYVLSDSRANGLWNFAAATAFLKNEKKTGVYVSYRNAGEGIKLHRGNRVLLQDSLSDRIRSVGDQWVLQYDEALVPHKNPAYSEHTQKNSLLPEKGKARLQKRTKELLYLRVYPGMPLPKVHPNMKAVLLEGYHSGTAPTDADFLKFLTALKERAIPVFLSGCCEDGTNYETLTILQSYGVLLLYDLSPAAQYAKLHLILSNDLPTVPMMQTVCAGEK